MKLVAFDMDGTLLAGRLVFALAERAGIGGGKVSSIQAKQLPGHEKTKMIAALFAGVSKRDVESAVESIPLAKNCERAISLLRGHGCRLGIISDSYSAATNIVAARLGMDFVAANELEFKRGVATGVVKMPLGWERIGCPCRLSVCKRFHLEKHARHYGVPVQETVSVGDTRADVCMVKRAGLGIAFMPKDADIKRAAEKVVGAPDMMAVAKLIVPPKP